MPARRTLHPPGKQGGFMLMQLTFVAALMVVGMVWLGGKIVQEIEDAQAEATGTYLMAVKGALDSMMAQHFTELTETSPPVVPGFANPLAPTLNELRAAGYLSNAFPLYTPTNQQVATRLQVSGSCPGVGCRLDGLAYTTTPLMLRSNAPREDLIARALMVMSGFGGASFSAAPGTIRGATFSTSNPRGNVAGILAVSANLDTTLFNQFVRLRDTRDPQLRGDLTVAGNITTDSGLMVRDSGGNDCITASGHGVLAINCNGQLNAKTGIFRSDSGQTVQIDPTTGVIASQRIQGNLGLATNRGSVFDAADATPTIRVTTGQMAIATSAGLAVTVANRDLVAHAGLTAGRLGVRETVTPNTTCSTQISTAAGANIEYARTATGGLAACISGQWRTIGQFGTIGTSCSPNGSFATDTTTGTGLVCRLGVWMRADDLFSAYVMVDSAVVTAGSIVPMPTCGQLGNTVGTPAIYLLAQNESSKGAAFTRRAVAVGSSWRIELLDYDNTPLSGPVKAIAQIYCKY